MPRAVDHRSSRRVRGLPALILICGAGAFGFGVWVTNQPPRHPRTGRVIADLSGSAAWFDRPSRAKDEATDTAIAALGLRPGMVVADIGAGTGFMSVRMSSLVGPTGRVYANDIQADLLGVLQERVRRERLTNVEIVEGTSRDARLPPGVLDLALLVDVYHEFAYPQAMLRSIRRALKPDGQMVLVEYRGEDTSLPIASTHRLRVAEAIAEIEPEGFVFERAVETLPRQHILYFRLGAPPNS